MIALPRIDRDPSRIFRFSHRRIGHKPVGFPKKSGNMLMVTTWCLPSILTKGFQRLVEVSNRHTYFSMLYAYVLRKASDCKHDERPGMRKSMKSGSESHRSYPQTLLRWGYFTDSDGETWRMSCRPIPNIAKYLLFFLEPATSEAM